MSDLIQLSSSALMALHDLKDASKNAKRYPDDDVEELRKALFVRDLPGGHIGITKDGLEFLMPPHAPRPYVPPVQRLKKPAMPPAPEVEKPTPPPAKPEGKKRGPKPGSKRTPKAKPTTAAALPAVTNSAQAMPMNNLVSLPEQLPVPAPAPKPADNNPCDDCPQSRALAFLMKNSPAIKAIVERFLAHEADQKRLQSLWNEDQP